MVVECPEEEEDTAVVCPVEVEAMGVVCPEGAEVVMGAVSSLLPFSRDTMFSSTMSPRADTSSRRPSRLELPTFP